MTKLPCEYIDLNSVQIKQTNSNQHGKWHATEEGFFCLSKAKHVNIQLVEIWKNAGHITLFDGTGRALQKWPSAFTGSFKLDVYAEDGLYVRLSAGSNICPNMTVTWKEVE